MRGFSLIEALVALLIASVVSAAMLRSGHSAIALRLEAVALREAVFAATRAIEDAFTVSAETLPEGSESWTTEADVAVSRTVSREPGSRLVTITVETRAPDGRPVRLETMRAAEWSLAR